MIRAFVVAELAEKEDDLIACTLGKWMDFASLPAAGDWLFYDVNNYPGGCIGVHHIEHFPADDVIRIVCQDKGCDALADASAPGWKFYRDELIAAGFVVTDWVWIADED